MSQEKSSNHITRFLREDAQIRRAAEHLLALGGLQSRRARYQSLRYENQRLRKYILKYLLLP